jgi:hypothetical protein
MKSLTRNRVVGVTVVCHLAYAKYLQRGRPSIGLAPLLVWGACLEFFAILTASVPVLVHKLRELGPTHLLTINNTSTGGRSSYQLSALESVRVVKGGTSVVREDVGTTGRDIGIAFGNAGDDDDDHRSVSFATTTQYGRRPSQDSEAAILPPPRM